MNDENSTACTCAACLRALAGQVKFCPFCGVAQSPAASVATTPATAPVPARAPEAAPIQPLQAPVPPPIAPAPSAKVTPPRKAAEQKAAKPVAPVADVPPPAPPPTSANPVITADADHGRPPPKRMSLLKKLVLVVAVILVGLWLKGITLRQSAQSAAQEGLERQITAAMTLAEGCKLDDARAALRALDEAKGTPQQHATVQKAISDAAPACNKQARHDAAWADAKIMTERALNSKNFERAGSVIKNFVTQWGDDDASRAMRDTINVHHVDALLDEAESCLKSGKLDCTGKNLPLAEALDQGDAKARIAGIQAELAQAREGDSATAPAGSASQAAAAAPAAPQAVRAAPQNPSAPVAASVPDPRLAALVNDASKRMNEGNYRGAEDLMVMCVSLDQGNRRCQEMRQRASQMNRTMLACVASGKEWFNERCD